MEKLYGSFENILELESLISGIFSASRNKEKIPYERVRIKPVLIKGEYRIQFAYDYKNKVIHENLNKAEALLKFKALSLNEFRNINIFTIDEDLEVLISKKKKVRINSKKPSKKTGEFFP